MLKKNTAFTATRWHNSTPLKLRKLPYCQYIQRKTSSFLEDINNATKAPKCRCDRWKYYSTWVARFQTV